MENGLLISDAAKAVQVESHVLRYWEEELKLPIQRNEQGHRYYTDADVERFKQIKIMKERGLQLKAIKMILKDGKFDVLTGSEAADRTAEGQPLAQPEEMYVPGNTGGADEEKRIEESREQKMRRLQWIMQQMIRQAVQENNAELVRQIRESVLKELDYQFRMQEEREEERDRKATQRAEQHYRQVDELLRKKSSRKKVISLSEKKKKKQDKEGETEASMEGQRDKKKKRFIF